MKQKLLIAIAMLTAFSVVNAEINTFTGYGQGTDWPSYTDQQQKAGFLPAVKHIRKSITAAELIAMYTTPKLLLAAPGSGKSIAVVKLELRMTRTSTAFTGGGAVIVQYDSTANGAGTQALDSTFASTVVTGAAGVSYSWRNGAVISDATTTVVNKGLYLSNDTAVFAAGTGTAIVDIYYVDNP
jgi:hypothetical protein